MKVTSEDLKKYKRIIDHVIMLEITPKELQNIIIRATERDPTNFRFLWKITRFLLYLQKRYREYQEGFLWKKKSSVEFIVDKWPEYKRLYRKYNVKPFNRFKEINNLLKLISDDRQDAFFKVRFKYHAYESIKKKIPQDIINKIR